MDGISAPCRVFLGKILLKVVITWGGYSPAPEKSNAVGNTLKYSYFAGLHAGGLWRGLIVKRPLHFFCIVSYCFILVFFRGSFLCHTRPTIFATSGKSSESSESMYYWSSVPTTVSVASMQSHSMIMAIFTSISSNDDGFSSCTIVK